MTVVAAFLLITLSCASVRQPAAAQDKTIPDIPRLIELLQHPDADRRQQAAKAVGEIGAEAEAAVPALIEALQDWNWDVQASAAWSLGQIGAEADAAVPALIEAMINEDRRFGGDAIGALGRIGAPAVPSLIALLDHEREVVPWNAASALGAVGSGSSGLDRNDEG